MKNFLITEEEKNQILRLHKLLTEDDVDQSQQVEAKLKMAGIDLTPEELDELKQGCYLDFNELAPEEKKEAEQLKQQADNMNDEQVIDKLIKLNSESQISEQQLTPQQARIGRISIGVLAFIVFIARLFRGRGNKACRKINRRYKRWGIKGVTESK